MRSAVVLSLPLCLVLVCARGAGAQSTRADTIPARTDSAAAAMAPPAAAPDSIAATGSSAAAAPADSQVAAPATPPDVAPAVAGAHGVAPGDVVRLQSGAGRYSGRVMRVTDDTLVVAAPGRTDAVVRSDISEMYRLAARGSRGRAMVRGGVVGLLGGAGLGLLAGTAVGDVRCDPQDTGCTPGHDSKIGAALTVEGALIGSLLGVMTGPALRRTTWERVDGAAPPPAASAASVSVRPATGGGVAVGATLRL